MASQLKNQLHTYPPGASETGCAYPYCPDPIANNIVLDDLNAVIDQTNLSNEIQQLLAVGLPAQSTFPSIYYHIVCDEDYVDPGQLSGMVADFCLCYEDPELAASNRIDCEILSDVYWYHPDYLGSNELITDITGEPYQYFFYTPFGETILQEDAFNASYDNPWRFNGKEIDAESENYYYGARYYNPRWSVWLGVDPLSHLSPDQTPYHFVSNNPVMRIDPNGLTDYELNKRGEITKVEGTETTTGTDRLIRGKARYDREGNLINRASRVFEVEKGILGRKDDQSDKGSLNISKLPTDDSPAERVQTFYMNKEQGSQQLFEFIANYINAEMMMIDVYSLNDEVYSVFITSHDRDEVDGSIQMLLALNSGNHEIYATDILRVVHNHPNQIGGRLGRMGPSDKDKEHKEYILNSIFPNPKETVLFQIYRKYGQYNPY